MHDAVVPGAARAPRSPPAAYEELFGLLGRLQGASSAALHELFFARKFSRDPRKTQARLRTLEAHGMVARRRLVGSQAAIFVLTEEGRRAFPALAPALALEALELNDQTASWAWRRSELLRLYAEDGWHVGQDLDALLAVRRAVLDPLRARLAAANRSQDSERLTKALKYLERSQEIRPHFHFVCPRCRYRANRDEVPQETACLNCRAQLVQEPVPVQFACTRCEYNGEETTHYVVEQRQVTIEACRGRIVRCLSLVDYDVAWRRTAAGFAVVLLLVDYPYRSLKAQLARLPLAIDLEQPPLPVHFVPSDDEGDPEAIESELVSARSKAFVRLANASGSRSAWPYARTMRRVDARMVLLERTVLERVLPSDDEPRSDRLHRLLTEALASLSKAFRTSSLESSSRTRALLRLPQQTLRELDRLLPRSAHESRARLINALIRERLENT